ncbi:hypothetical protein [Amphibacillus indicireducens]|uniref:Uncharacterized protein n=1 Tax=Amphibacillus indicireducens TaxID=1076330 RepID=A0ABP7VJD1_9BACI|nr:hypothetical protein [Clostridiaceae bacterium]
MMENVILGLIAILGSIISGIWSYKSAVKKSESDLVLAKEKSKAEIESIKIQADNELDKIKEQALAEAQLHEEKMKTDLTAKQFENPLLQKMLGEAIGPVLKLKLEQEIAKQFSNVE